MKDRHTITQNELDEWLRRPQWHMFASSGSSTSRKRLEIDVAASGDLVFRVVDHDEVTFIGADRAAAVAAYNAAP